MPDKLVNFTSSIELISQSFHNNKEITLVTTDSDYLFIGKTIRDEITERGFFVNLLSLNDDCVDTSVLNDLFTDLSDNIVAVGSSIFLNHVRTVLSEKQKNILLVVTDLNFFSVISDYGAISENGRLKVEKMPTLPMVVDPKIITKLKKTAIMESFLEVVSKLSWAVDFVNSSLIKKQKVDKDIISELLSIIFKLKNIGSDYAQNVLTIINTQCLLADFSQKYDLSLFGEETFIGDLLSKILNQSIYCCQYVVFRPLIDLYAHILQNNLMKNEIVPDYRTNIIKLCELKKCKEIDILSSYKPLSYDEIMGVGKEWEKTSLAYMKRFLGYFNELDEMIKYLFSGRKKICKFKLEDMKNAFCLSAYQNATDFYKLINDSGVFDVFE